MVYRSGGSTLLHHKNRLILPENINHLGGITLMV